MIDTAAFREFKQGLNRMRDADPERALVHIRRAVELESNNPFYLSYLGVLLARAERKWGDAEELCQAALRMRRDQAQLYMNLAEVYVCAGRREDAAEILNRGLKNARRDIRLARMLGQLAMRRPPVLPFLERQHFLNKNLGRLRHRTLEYFGVT